MSESDAERALAWVAAVCTLVVVVEVTVEETLQVLPVGEPCPVGLLVLYVMNGGVCGAEKVGIFG